MTVSELAEFCQKLAEEAEMPDWIDSFRGMPVVTSTNVASDKAYMMTTDGVYEIGGIQVGGDMAKPGSETTVMTQTLYYRDPATNSDKVYVATLERGANGSTVTFEWGRRGAANLQSKSFGPMSPAAARLLYNDKLTEKMNKGYRDRLDDAGMTYASSQTLKDSRDGVTSLSEINKIAERIMKEVTEKQFGAVFNGAFNPSTAWGPSVEPQLRRRQDSVDDEFGALGGRPKPVAKPEPEIESKTGRLIILDD